MTDLILIVLGALLGAVASHWYPKVQQGIVEYRRERRIAARRALETSGDVSQWLIDYYIARGLHTGLFDCKIGASEAKLPFLTKPEWQRVMHVTHDGPRYVHFAEPVGASFSIDSSLIRQRQELGQRLFNDATLYLDRIEVRPDGFHLHVKPCRYFEMLSRLAALEEETFAAVRDRRFTRTPLRDLTLSNLTDNSLLNHKPYSAACVVALALRTAHGYEILLHTRSHETVTFGGSKALLPTFGLNPIIPPDPEGDVLMFNMVKEYCEELFKYDDLVEAMSRRRVDPYWFFSLPEAIDLLSVLKAGDAKVEIVGFGFDGLNGTGTLGVLLRVEDLKFGLRVRQRIEANWEVAQRPNGDATIEFLNVTDRRLEEYLRAGRYHYGAAFTISRALERLRVVS